MVTQLSMLNCRYRRGLRPLLHTSLDFSRVQIFHAIARAMEDINIGYIYLAHPVFFMPARCVPATQRKYAQSVFSPPQIPQQLPCSEAISNIRRTGP
jgi:hypothetical protein